MKFLAIIFGIFGLLFILMGIYFGQFVSNLFMAIIFFCCGIVFWLNSKEEPLYNRNKEISSETLEESKELMKKLEKLRNNAKKNSDKTI